MKNLIVIFGVPDHESRTAIELCHRLGVTTATATVAGKPCHAGNALLADGFVRDDDREAVVDDTQLILFECGSPHLAMSPMVIAVCDHHNPGDMGFGLPPARYWAASSLGQLWYSLQLCGLIPWGSAPQEIEKNGDIVGIPLDLLMVAAGDHCPADVYAGRCPGIDPVYFGQFRRAQIAAHAQDIIAPSYGDPVRGFAGVVLRPQG
jgi:hypothetical protein